MRIEFPVGTSLGGKYRIERLLGEGGVGTVYAAEQVETGKRVALKCVDISTAPDPAAAERLVREAQAAARIRHPNVVDIYDVGRAGQIMFLVMEYLEGEPLSAAFARGGMPAHKLISLLLPAMRGVAEAHRRGVVHRDIKPENIFLARHVDSREPTAMVLDFGISKLLDPLGQPMRSLTADGHVIGTPYYMSYEQTIGEKGIDGRVDVYAFGVILYQALTGEVPRKANDFAALAQHFLTKSALAPAERTADVPRELSSLVMWAIERDRELRVSSMESLIRELEPFAAEAGFRSVEGARKPVPKKGGRTLVGPWGMDQGKPASRPKVVAAQPAVRESDGDLGTVDVVLWLKRKRTRQLTRTWLLAGVVVLVLGLLVFSWVPRDEPPPRAGKERVTVQQAALAAPSAEVPVAPEPSAAPNKPEVPAQPLPQQEAPAAQRAAALPQQEAPAAAQPKPTAAKPAAAPPPARHAAPVQPAATPAPRKPVAKERNYGIY